MRIVLSLAASLFLLAATAVTPPVAGSRAPDFNLRDENGARVKLSAQHGSKVVLVFYRGYW